MTSKRCVFSEILNLYLDYLATWFDEVYWFTFLHHPMLLLGLKEESYQLIMIFLILLALSNSSRLAQRRSALTLDSRWCSGYRLIASAAAAAAVLTHCSRRELVARTHYDIIWSSFVSRPSQQNILLTRRHYSLSSICHPLF